MFLSFCMCLTPADPSVKKRSHPSILQQFVTFGLSFLGFVVPPSVTLDKNALQIVIIIILHTHVFTFDD